MGHAMLAFDRPSPASSRPTVSVCTRIVRAVLVQRLAFCFGGLFFLFTIPWGFGIVGPRSGLRSRLGGSGMFCLFGIWDPGTWLVRLMDCSCGR
ncbi:hypothetical protein IQ07DRAFT_174899 [Pyrenochaeta sp. DS3sAY3a]|nr:hypothetical protein IQ07DRAFT_174899 [Pyrenochaeta sp. DS3sAY3a]